MLATLVEVPVTSTVTLMTLAADRGLSASIEVARRQCAKSWEQRAALSLSRLWQQQEKHAEAREVLAEIYGWFTEGFDTHDLTEARALLDALQSGHASMSPLPEGEG